MNKQAVLQSIVAKLNIDLDVAQRAAQTAYETATHEENIAENKYDTLGLEASYLAAGQARRVEEIRQSLKCYQDWPFTPFDASRGIRIGDLIRIENGTGQAQYLFLGPDAAGLKVSASDQLITVITPRAPLGQQLLGKFADDDVQIVINGSEHLFEITHIF
ncbi:transcription elongation factor GreAB [Pseudomonas viridiflava]|uniref:GreA/GreB family transcription elongation factor n=1 Tax=Pseudomonas viridiflava TaxID=33069 RepID=A0A3M5PLA2_PSEVI|nr:transcription elongation factor GreAB [Pseudomonas viridiflava]MBA1230609.1 transcription elongation factor GreAB [Pseudomonas viridiflava]RMT84826.1 GreA/GreB family transcription elongation factor [Pseudomonas viridiflava]